MSRKVLILDVKVTYYPRKNWKFGQRKVCLFVTRRCNGLFVEFSVVLFLLRCTALVYMPGRFPEIPEILYVDYTLGWTGGKKILLLAASSHTRFVSKFK